MLFVGYTWLSPLEDSDDGLHGSIASPTTSNPGTIRLVALCGIISPNPITRPNTPSSCCADADARPRLHAVAWVRVTTYVLTTYVVTTILV